MSKFIKEYWLWMLLPVVLVFGVTVVLLYLSADSNGDDAFIYNIL